MTGLAHVILVVICSAAFYCLVFVICKSLLTGISGAGEAEREEKRVCRYDWAAGLVIYTLVTVLFFYPALRHLDASLIGPPEDNLHHLWLEWWANRAISGGGAGLTYSPLIFHPEGASLLYNDFCWYNHLWAFFLRLFLDPVPIYNLLILHTFVLAGLGAFFLVRYLTGDSALGLVGGLVYAFNPYHYSRALHHPTYASIQFIPFFFLFYLKSLREDRLRNPLLAGGFLLLTALSSWTYLLFLLGLMASGYLCLAIRQRRLRLPRVLKITALIAAPPLLVLSPWLVRMILAGLRHPEVAGLGHDTYVTDLFALFTPYPYHWASGLSLIRAINLRFTGNPWEAAAYLGVINILLVLAGYRGSAPRTARWFCGFWFFLILSGGVYIHLLGRSLPVALPFLVLRHIPLLSNLRAPGRLIILVYLFWAVIVARSLGSLLERVPSAGKKAALCGLAGLLILVDFFPDPTPVTPLALPPAYKFLKDRGEDFAILELPGGWRNATRYMAYQTLHGIPMVEGALSRKIGKSLIDRLDWRDLDRQREQLAGAKVRYIVVHKNLSPGWRRLDLDRYCRRYPTIYEDAGNAILQVY